MQIDPVKQNGDAHANGHPRFFYMACRWGGLIPHAWISLNRQDHMNLRADIRVALQLY